jgi:hypothetical protein
MMFRVVPGWVKRAAHITLLQLSLVGILSFSASGASVTLAWDPSPDPTAVGYYVYHGVTSRNYPNKVNVGNVTTCTISNLVEGTTYYFAATTYDLAGLESDFSPEVSYYVPIPATNQPPTLDPIANVVINENTASQTVGLSGISSGSATETQTLSITAVSSNPSLIPNPQVTYTSPNTTGALSFTPATYGNGSATITVTVNDGGASNNIFARIFTVTVLPVNQPPTLDAIPDLNLSENAASQTVNLTGISAGAPNENQSLTVTAVSSNPALIPNPKVNYTSPKTTGNLSFTPAANAVGSATLTVTVNDGGASNNVISRTFTVAVTAVNQPPTLNSIGNLVLNENAGLQTVSLSGISPGSASENQFLTVTAVSSNPGLIPNPSVSYTSPNATGTLTFTPVPYEFGAATVTVTVNDGAASNNVTSRSFSVTVYPVNQAPTLNPLANVVLNQNASLQTIALTGISCGATNENQTLTVSASSSNQALIPTPAVNYTSPNTSGTLTFTPVANASGSASILVTVNDGATSNNVATQSFIVTVNKPPFISSINDLAIATGTDTGPIPFTIGDTETAPALLSVTSSSSDPLLVPNSAIVFGGTGANRTVTVTPVTGQTGLVSIALSVSDGLATASTSFQLTVQNRPSPPGNLHIVIQGAGTLSPNLTTQSLVPGKTYKVTAIPDADQEFAGWTGSVTSSSPTITFVMSPDFSLQANFVRSPFVPAAGLYDGLFYQSAGIDQQSAGAIRLVCTKRGVYSGSLRLGPFRYAFRGRFGLDCQATNVILRRTNSPLQLELLLGSAEGQDQVTGRLTDGSWTALVSGDRAVFNARTNVAPWARSYTFVLPGQDSDPALPRAHGYGVGYLSAAGVGRLAGMLADGTRFSQGAYVSRRGQWPFYSPLYAGNGMLLSWLAFTNRAGDDFNGALSWIKPQLPKARYFPDGFNYECEAIGSIYTVQNPLTPVLGYSDAHVNFTGGNLGQDFANAIQLGMLSRVTNLSSNRLSLGFALGNGAFRGAVLAPTVNRAFSFVGVAFQKQNAAYGMLFGTNQTSRVVISN